MDIQEIIAELKKIGKQLSEGPNPTDMLFSPDKKEAALRKVARDKGLKPSDKLQELVNLIEQHADMTYPPLPNTKWYGQKILELVNKL